MIELVIASWFDVMFTEIQYDRACFVGDVTSPISVEPHQPSDIPRMYIIYIYIYIYI